MKRVLFVDDEPNVLDGLRRMLRPLRSEWDMAFAPDGPTALTMMAEQPFDVVVTDMRMPGMDGAEVLTQVMERWPSAVRIVLSGQSDTETILRSVGPTHQFLAKPCDAETLRDTVQRACALRELLADQLLTEVAAEIDSLPSLPTLYLRIVEAVRHPDTSVAEVGRLIAGDLGMSAKVLQLVNSAFFGIRRHVASPQQAVALLGLDTIRALVLHGQVFKQFPRSVLKRFSLQALEHHCITVGAYARRLAQLESAPQRVVDNAFMAGLLHDVGKLLLAANLPDVYEEAMRLCDEEGCTPLEAEREVFGASHAEVGAYLLGLWGLADPIVEAVAFHHQPGRCLGRGFEPLTAVHVANAVELAGAGEPPVDLEYLTRLGLAERLPDWLAACAGGEAGQTDG